MGGNPNWCSYSEMVEMVSRWDEDNEERKNNVNNNAQFQRSTVSFLSHRVIETYTYTFCSVLFSMRVGVKWDRKTSNVYTFSQNDTSEMISKVNKETKVFG